MAEYIERKALIEKIVNTPTVPIKQCYEGNFVYADGTASRQNEIINYITEQPAADVVEVVRCKDCEKWDTSNKLLNTCACTRWSQSMPYPRLTSPDDFCSYGHRKEGAEE